MLLLQAVHYLPTLPPVVPVGRYSTLVGTIGTMQYQSSTAFQYVQGACDFRIRSSDSYLSSLSTSLTHSRKCTVSRSFLFSFFSSCHFQPAETSAGGPGSFPFFPFLPRLPSSPERTYLTLVSIFSSLFHLPLFFPPIPHPSSPTLPSSLPPHHHLSSSSFIRAFPARAKTYHTHLPGTTLF